MSEELSASKRDGFNGSSTVHVAPLAGPKHETDGDGVDCWCSPEFEHFDNGNHLAIHRLHS